MAKIATILVALALGGCLAPIHDHGRAGERRQGPVFTLSLPVILPPLVVIRPGLSVVADLDEEVFYTSDGYYWALQDAQWYHTRDPHGVWVRVEHSRVSPALTQSPPGHYRRWRGDHQGRRQEDDEQRGRRSGRGEHNGNHD